MVELLLALFVDGCKEDFNVLVVTSSCFKFVTFFEPPQPGRDEGESFEGTRNWNEEGGND